MSNIETADYQPVSSQMKTKIRLGAAFVSQTTINDEDPEAVSHPKPKPAKLAQSIFDLLKNKFGASSTKLTESEQTPINEAINPFSDENADSLCDSPMVNRRKGVYIHRPNPDEHRLLNEFVIF